MNRHKELANSLTPEELHEFFVTGGSTQPQKPFGPSVSLTAYFAVQRSDILPQTLDFLWENRQALKLHGATTDFIPRHPNMSPELQQKVRLFEEETERIRKEYNDAMNSPENRERQRKLYQQIGEENVRKLNELYHFDRPERLPVPNETFDLPENLPDGIANSLRPKKAVSLDLRKIVSWDQGNYAQDYHPGSNTAGPVDRTVPRSNRDLPPGNQRTKEDYHSPSLLDREPEETGQGGTQPTNKGDAPTNRPDDDPWGESNFLRPFKGLRPKDNLPQDFNSGWDTEYVQRQFGSILGLKRFVLSVIHKARGVTKLSLNEDSGEILSDSAWDQLDPIDKAVIKDVYALEYKRAQTQSPQYYKYYTYELNKLLNTTLPRMVDILTGWAEDHYEVIDHFATDSQSAIEIAWEFAQSLETINIPQMAVDDKIVLFHKILNMAHTSGVMAEHMIQLPTEDYTDWYTRINQDDEFVDGALSPTAEYLQQLSGDKYINEWNKELRRETDASHKKRIVATFANASLQTSDIPNELIKLIRNIQKNIPDEKLSNSNNDDWIKNGIQDKIHLTVLFGVQNSAADTARDIFEKHSPLSITTKKLKYFDNTDATVAVVECTSDDLQKLHKELTDNIPNNSTHSYTPHITIAYLKPGERLDDAEISEISWKIDSLEISKTDGKLEKLANIPQTLKASKLNWDSLISGPMKKEDIQPTSPAIKDAKWQEFRKSLKGLANEEKYRKLKKWLRDHNNSERAKIQVTNYVNALKRGGQVAATMARTIHKSSKNSAETREIAGKKYTKCSHLGLSGSLAAAFEVIKRDGDFWVPSNRWTALQNTMKDIEKDLKKASILDRPREELDPAIWQRASDPDELPMLKPDVRVHIVFNFMDYLKNFGGYLNPQEWIKNMFYTGSTATYTYHDKSDIDIHVIIDWEDMIRSNPSKTRENLEQTWQELHDVFWWTLNKTKLPGTKHPLTYYVLKPGEEKSIIEQKEEIYDIGHNVWLIPPSEQHVKVPEQAMAIAISEATDIIERIEEYVTDARLFAIDYDMLKLLQRMSAKTTPVILQRLEEKRQLLDGELVKLKDEYAFLKQKRRDAFQDGKPVAPSESKNFTLGNIIFKLVERYKLMDILRKIKKITDAQPLEHTQVDEISVALGLSEDEDIQ